MQYCYYPFDVWICKICALWSILDGSEDGDLICISLLPELQGVCVHNEELDPFECDITEEDMAQEDVLHLIIDDDDDEDNDNIDVRT